MIPSKGSSDSATQSLLANAQVTSYQSSVQINQLDSTKFTPISTSISLQQVVSNNDTDVAIEINTEEYKQSRLPTILCFNDENTQPSNWENFWGKTGKVTTFFAMVPLAVFGMLFFNNHVVDEENVYIRIIADVVVFITTEEGKRRLISYLNDLSFRGLAQVKFIDFHPRNLTVTNTLNMLLTANISLTYAGLAITSWSGDGCVAALLKSHDTSATDVLASIANNRYFHLPFMTAALIANLTCYPDMHRKAIALLSRELKELPRLKQPTLHRIVEAVRLYLRFLYEQYKIAIKIPDQKKYKSKYITVLQAIVADEHDYSTNLIKSDIDVKKIVHFVKQNRENLDFQAALKRAEHTKMQIGVTKFFRLILTGATAAGMYNIFALQPTALNAVCETFGLPPLENKIAQYCLQTGAFISSISLSVTAIFSLVDSIAACIAGQASINVYTLKSLIYAGILTGVFCVLGGASNVFMSLDLAKQGKALAILSAFASCNLEVMGFLRYTLSSNKENLPKFERIAASVDSVLTEIAQSVDDYLPLLKQMRIDESKESVKNETKKIDRGCWNSFCNFWRSWCCNPRETDEALLDITKTNQLT